MCTFTASSVSVNSLIGSIVAVLRTEVSGIGLTNGLSGRNGLSCGVVKDLSCRHSCRRRRQGVDTAWGTTGESVRVGTGCSSLPWSVADGVILNSIVNTPHWTLCVMWFVPSQKSSVSYRQPTRPSDLNNISVIVFTFTTFVSFFWKDPRLILN